MYCGCKMNWEVTQGLPYAISLQHQSKPLTTTVSPVCLQPGQPLCGQNNQLVFAVYRLVTLRTAATE